MSPAKLHGRRLAATVLLLRDSVDGIEVYVQERVSSMPTFPNATVFPGGSVDPRDFDVDPATSALPGSALQRWSQLLGVEPDQARALIFAAVRELFEETGTLLAVHADGRPITDATPYHPQRLALESHRLALTEFLSKGELTLRSDLLRPFARWISPQEDPHQFDVFSFVAVQPPGQEPDASTAEAASAGWFRPQILLDGWRAGLLTLVLPTWAQLRALTEFGGVQEVLDALRGRRLAPYHGTPEEDPSFEEFFSLTPPKRF